MGEPPTQAAEPPPPGETLPPYVEPPAAGKGRGRLIAGAIGLVAVAAAAVFAATSLAGGDDGADSPEAAVEAMLDAVASEDLIGVMEALPPGERSALRGGVEDIASELQRVGVLSDDFDLGGVPGFDIEFEGVELESEALGEGVSVVRFTAGVTNGTVVPEDFPLGETITGVLEDEGVDTEPEGGTDTEELTGMEVVAIEEGGGWHVSLFYSVAEAARVGSGSPEPDFGNGIEPSGADSPEGAIQALAERAVDLDIEGMLALLPPDEMRVIHDYAPLFLEDAVAEVADAQSELDLTIDDIGMDVEGGGDTRTVTIQTFALSGSTADGDIRISWDGECFETEFDGEDEIFCADDGFGQAFGVFEGTLVGATAGGIVVVERDGSWFVSPTRTILAVLTAFLETIEPEDIENFDTFLEEVFDFGALEGGGVIDDEDEPATTTTVPDTTVTTTPGETTTTAGGDTSTTVSEDGLLAPVPVDEFEFNGERLDTESDCSGLTPDPTTCYALAEACFGGDMVACDDLYFASEIDSAFEAYGSTCAWRLPENPTTCVEAIGETAPN